MTSTDRVFLAPDVAVTLAPDGSHSEEGERLLVDFHVDDAERGEGITFGLTEKEARALVAFLLAHLPARE